MTPEASDWNELGWLAERHKALVAAKDALSLELLREIEANGIPPRRVKPLTCAALLHCC